jgi:hypothetical protein
MKFARETTVCLLDLIGRGIAGDIQYPVVILVFHLLNMWQEARARNMPRMLCFI